LNEEEKKYLNIGMLVFNRNSNVPRSLVIDEKPLNLQVELRMSADASEHKASCDNPDCAKQWRNGVELELQTAF
jgi:hypothetical protein